MILLLLLLLLLMIIITNITIMTIIPELGGTEKTIQTLLCNSLTFRTPRRPVGNPENRVPERTVKKQPRFVLVPPSSQAQAQAARSTGPWSIRQPRQGIFSQVAGSRPLPFRGHNFICKRGGRVLLTEMLLPRIARQGAVCLVSTRGQARTTRIEKFELDADFQPYHPPFRI